MLGRAGRQKIRPFRLVEKVDGGDQFVGNELAIERQRKIRSIRAHMLPGGFIEAVGVRLGVEYHAEWRAFPIQKPVAKIYRRALQPRSIDIVESGDAADMVGCCDRGELQAKILDGYEFEFGRGGQRAIGAGALSEAPGRLILEFPLAGLADIGPDSKAEQMLGIDAFGMQA